MFALEVHMEALSFTICSSPFFVVLGWYVVVILSTSSISFDLFSSRPYHHCLTSRHSLWILKRASISLFLRSPLLYHLFLHRNFSSALLSHRCTWPQVVLVPCSLFEGAAWVMTMKASSNGGNGKTISESSADTESKIRLPPSATQASCTFKLNKLVWKSVNVYSKESALELFKCALDNIASSCTWP